MREGEAEGERVTVLPPTTVEEARRLQAAADKSIRRSKRRARGILTRADLKAQKGKSGR
jgi:hypothetical protein